MDFRIRFNRTMCVSGPSHSGKTTFTMNLLKNRNEVFDTQPNRVLWCYGIYDYDLNSRLTTEGYLTHAGIPSISDIQPYDLIVLDDLLNESKNSKEVTDMFTKAAHHKPCFIIFIMQTLFPPGKESRTRSLNTHYYVIFKNPRDKSQIQIFARQIFPLNSKAFINAFNAATTEAHGYLFLDFTQECPDAYRFRSHLFDESKPMQLYKILSS